MLLTLGKYMLLTLLKSGKYMLLKNEYLYYSNACFTLLGRKRGNTAGEPAPGEPAQKKAQVGRGRRQSLGGHAQQENDSDLLLEMRQQENRIRQHLIAKLDNGMKWYIIVFAEFKKDALVADGTMTEKKRETISALKPLSLQSNGC